MQMEPFFRSEKPEDEPDEFPAVLRPKKGRSRVLEGTKECGRHGLGPPHRRDDGHCPVGV
jgi:hypothetical protein